jgi:hypothetical protein
VGASLESGFQGRFNLPHANIMKVKPVGTPGFQGRDTEVLAGYVGEGSVGLFHEDSFLGWWLDSSVFDRYG